MKSTMLVAEYVWTGISERISRRQPDNHVPFTSRKFFVCKRKGKVSVQDQKSLRKESKITVQLDRKAKTDCRNKLISRRRVCEYLVLETNKDKGTIGVCWKSNIHGLSIRQTYIPSSKRIFYNVIRYYIKSYRSIEGRIILDIRNLIRMGSCHMEDQKS